MRGFKGAHDVEHLVRDPGERPDFRSVLLHCAIAREIYVEDLRVGVVAQPISTEFGLGSVMTAAPRLHVRKDDHAVVRPLKRIPEMGP